VLEGVSGRDWMRTAITRSTRHAQRSRPIGTTSGRVFEWRAEADDEKLRFSVRPADDAPLEPVLDPNGWPDDEALVFAVPSPDGSRVAFGTARGSTHHPKIRLLEVDTGRVLLDQPWGRNHSSVAWRPDGSSFFYTADPEPGAAPAGEEAFWNAVYEHRVGVNAPARRVFGAVVKEYWCSVEVSECGRFAVLTTWDFVHANAVFLMRLDDDSMVRVTPEMGSLNHVQVIDDWLLIRTDLDAPRGRCCVAPLSDPTAWRTIIPESDDTLLSVTGVAGRLYAVSSRVASHRVRVHAIDGSPLRDVELPGIGSVDHDDGGGVYSGIHGDWAGDDVWIDFTSWAQPPSVYHYDFTADRLVPYHVPDGGLEPASVATEEVWFDSPDGTRVPMTIIQRRDLQHDGPRPVRLSGYGGFNISVKPRFVALNAAWLELGGVVAYAHIRGGGELGRAWHEAAVRTHRQRAFDDYIAAARWLVSEGIATPATLLSRGNSNGGLLVTVTALQAPDAFAAVFSRVPNLDMLGFTRHGFGGAATVEYGSPDDPVEGAVLAGYSPYHTIQADRPYPPMLFVSALNDRVAPRHDPLKMVARLQAEATAGGPYILLPLRDSGHGGGTTLAALIEQDVDELSFTCWALDVPAQPS
jgi:prolyl oligopeptidase